MDPTAAYDVLVSLAARGKGIAYAELMEALKFQSVQQMEGFIIGAIYEDIIKGRLNPKKQMVEVSDWRAPLPSKAELEHAAGVMSAWMESTDAFMQSLNEEANRSNQRMLDGAAREKGIEEETERMRKEFLSSAAGKLSGIGVFTPDKTWSKNSDAKRHKKESALRFKRSGGN